MSYLNFVDWRPRRRHRRARACALSAALLIAATTALALLFNLHNLRWWQQQQHHWQAYQTHQQQLSQARQQQQEQQQRRQLSSRWQQQQQALLGLLAGVNMAAGESGAKLARLAWQQQQLRVTALVDNAQQGAELQRQLQQLPLAVSLQHSQRQTSATGKPRYRLRFQLQRSSADGRP